MTDKIVGNLIETSNEAAGYSLGPSEISEVLALRARVAKLEAALKETQISETSWREMAEYWETLCKASAPAWRNWRRRSLRSPRQPEETLLFGVLQTRFWRLSLESWTKPSKRRPNEDPQSQADQRG